MVFMRRSGGTAEGRDVALCEECAKGRGIRAGEDGLDLDIDALFAPGLESSGPRGKPAACPVCGLELSELMRTGRLGCAGCADAFDGEIARALGRRLPLAASEDLDFPATAQPRRLDPESLDPSRLKAELESALASEDYERAAQVRDELSRRAFAASGPEAGMKGSDAERPSAPSFPADFPLPCDSFSYSRGADDDVVLWSSAKALRDLEGLSFPGSPKGPPSPSRSLLLERLPSLGWSSRTMGELGSAARRSLAERGILSRGYAADEGAVLVSAAREGGYLLLDEIDHVVVRSLRPGFDPASALSASLAHARRIGELFPLAMRPSIGWVCSRLADCGLGASVSCLVHIPALAATGMRDRLFRALMAESVFIRGFYSTGEESSGSLYEIGIESAVSASLKGMVASLSSAVAKVVKAERRARAEASERSGAALADAEGRAFGIVAHCGLLGPEEAASLLSSLRLAALRGTLSGADPRALGSLLLSLGSGSVALASGLRELPEEEESRALRSRLVKTALAETEYIRVEEGA